MTTEVAPHLYSALELVESAVICCEASGAILYANGVARELYGESETAEAQDLSSAFQVEESPVSMADALEHARDQRRWRGEAVHVSRGGRVWVDWSLRLIEGRPPLGQVLISEARDISELKKKEGTLQGRLAELTGPAASARQPRFEELVDINVIQQIQDAFAQATGVASVITDAAGTPLTRPSNFCRLCNEIVRKTPRGRANCFRSDAELGRGDPSGPVFRPCLSAGLWDGGAAIKVGEQQVANWLIGQVRNEDLDRARTLNYAKEIGVDEETFRAALDEVTVMSTHQFAEVCRALYLIANLISDLAFKNARQANLIAELQFAEQSLRESKEELTSAYRKLEALNSAQEELVRQRTSELRAAQAQLLRRERLATIGELTATVSHEIRNPLGSVRNAMAVIAHALPKGDVARLERALHLAGRGVARCTRIIDELLDYTRKQPPHLETTRVDEWLAGVLDEELLGVDVVCVAELESGLELAIDRERLRRVIVNLLTNAVQAFEGQSIADKRITVKTRASHSGLDIVVADNGPGIPAAVRERMFEPLYSTKPFGVGLGMSIVKRVVEEHGGEVQVETAVGGGTTVVLHLPRAETPTLDAAVRLSSSPP